MGLGPPGCVEIDVFPSVSPAEAANSFPAPVSGKALIFWDPKLPGTRYGRKLDAIDTDEITPAADRVSESYMAGPSELGLEWDPEKYGI